MLILSILIMLALAAVVLYCGYLIIVGIVYLVAFVVTGIQLRTGQLTREQLAESAAKYREQKRQEKERKRIVKWWRDVTRPTAMDVALGRGCRPKQFNINIEIDKGKC